MPIVRQDATEQVAISWRSVSATPPGVEILVLSFIPGVRYATRGLYL